MDDSNSTPPTDLYALVMGYFAGSVTLDQAADALASDFRGSSPTSLEDGAAFLQEWNSRREAKTPPDVILSNPADLDPKRKQAIDLLNLAVSRRLNEGAS